MLYNVFINNGIAVKVTDYNPHCVPCNDNIGDISFQERKIINIKLPPDIKNNRDFESIKKYINLNNIL